MDFEQHLRASMVAPKPGPLFTAKVLARIARGGARRRGRFIVVSSVLVLAAAASMLVWQLDEDQPLVVEVATTQEVSGAGPVVEGPVVQSVAATGEPESARAAQLQASEPRFTVHVLPLRQE